MSHYDGICRLFIQAHATLFFIFLVWIEVPSCEALKVQVPGSLSLPMAENHYLVLPSARKGHDGLGLISPKESFLEGPNSTGPPAQTEESLI